MSFLTMRRGAALLAVLVLIVTAQVVALRIGDLPEELRR